MSDSLFDPEELESLAQLRQGLRAGADQLDATGAWPREQLRRLADFGVFEWFLPREWDGREWSEAKIAAGLMELAAGCLTTTFVLSQWVAASRRLVGSANEALKGRLRPQLAAGDHFLTVGISHLTTSSRHLARPAVQVREAEGGLRFDGVSPWVTGGVHARTIVTGGEFEDGRQVLVALSTESEGVTPGEPVRLLGLSASQTGPVRCDGAQVGLEDILAGPDTDLLAKSKGLGSGGLHTSALAIGHALGSLEYVQAEFQRRPNLDAPYHALQAEAECLRAALIEGATGAQAPPAADLRASANSLALRASQTALSVAKGAGYLREAAPARWCREALFFLVWSCPQPVVDANLCELAGLA